MVVVVVEVEAEVELRIGDVVVAVGAEGKTWGKLREPRLSQPIPSLPRFLFYTTELHLISTHLRLTSASPPPPPAAMNSHLPLRTMLLLRPAVRAPTLLSNAARSYSTPAHLTDPINTPITTLPPPLILPTKEADSTPIGHAYRTGKAYVCLSPPSPLLTTNPLSQLTFFKTGLYSVITNYKTTRPIQDLLDTHPLPTLIHTSKITRSQYQHLMRARHDMRRLPVFGLLVFILGESSPFVLPFVPNLVPHPCRIPAQLKRQRRIAAEARENSYTAIGDVEPESVVGRTHVLNEHEVKHVAKVLGVYSRWVPLDMVNRHRVRRWVEYLAHDDMLMRKHGGVEKIAGGEELLMAAQERGIDTHEKEEEEVRSSLQEWEKVTAALGGVDACVWLVKPASWRKIAAHAKKEE